MMPVLSKNQSISTSMDVETKQSIEQIAAASPFLIHEKRFYVAGLHFNISEGRPLTDVRLISSLVDQSGCFYGKDGTKAAAEEGKLVLAHVRGVFFTCSIVDICCYVSSSV